MKYRLGTWCCVAAAALVVGCSKYAEEGSLNIKVSAGDAVAAGVAAKRLADAPSLARAVAASINLTDSNQIISFTPSSYKITIHSVNIFSEWTQNTNGEWIGSGLEVSANIEDEVELVGQTKLNALVNEMFTFDSSKFGDYIGVKVLLDDSASVSGTLTINGSDHIFTDLRVSIGMGGLQYRLPAGQTVRIAADAEASVELIFDIENSLCLYNSARFATSRIADGVHVWAWPPILTPYVGATLPSTQKFSLTLGYAAGPDNQTYHIAGMAVLDAAGAIINASWMAVYHQNYQASGGGIELYNMRIPLITRNSDGSYDIGNDRRYCTLTEYFMDLRVADLKLQQSYSGNGWLRSETDSVAITYTVALED